jgi:hypothetical protein
VPPNCQFELDNAQLEWTYTPNKFDFVHLRCLFGSIKDWPALYQEVYKYDCLSFAAPFFRLVFFASLLSVIISPSGQIWYLLITHCHPLLKNQKGLLTQSEFRCTKPGGYIEQLELSIEFKSDDDSLGPDHFMRLWSKTFVDYGEMQGKTFKIANLAKNYIEEAVCQIPLPPSISLFQATSQPQPHVL